MFNKCEFRFRWVDFLCHIVFSEWVEVDPRKIEVVKSWPRPLSPTDIQSFLGVARYNRRFVEGFSPIESPLTTLTQKSPNLNGRNHVKKVNNFSKIDTPPPWY